SAAPASTAWPPWPGLSVAPAAVGPAATSSAGCSAGPARSKAAAPAASPTARSASCAAPSTSSPTTSAATPPAGPAPRPPRPDTSRFRTPRRHRGDDLPACDRPHRLHRPRSLRRPTARTDHPRRLGLPDHRRRPPRRRHPAPCPPDGGRLPGPRPATRAVAVGDPTPPSLSSHPSTTQGCRSQGRRRTAQTMTVLALPLAQPYQPFGVALPLEASPQDRVVGGLAGVTGIQSGSLLRHDRSAALRRVNSSSSISPRAKRSARMSCASGRRPDRESGGRIRVTTSQATKPHTATMVKTISSHPPQPQPLDHHIIAVHLLPRPHLRNVPYRIAHP